MDKGSVLAEVIDTIRATVNEDWIADYEIGAETRLSEDLDLESIEFVKLAEALQTRFAGADLIGWLSGKTLPELVGLEVGMLVAVVQGEPDAGTADRGAD